MRILWIVLMFLQLVLMAASRTSNICENDSSVVSCPPGYKLDINNANYGRTSTWICPSTLDTSRTSCRNHEQNALNIVRRRCQGRQSCQLTASNAVFGDTCLDIWKYLEVRYNCKSICKPIVHCLTPGYSSSRPSCYCAKCVSNKYFYKPTTRDTKCERMCAWDNHFCWPGRCVDDLKRNCVCSDGFSMIQTSSETTCQPTQKPLFETCAMKTVGPNGEIKRSKTIGPTTDYASTRSISMGISNQRY